MSQWKRPYIRILRVRIFQKRIDRHSCEVLIALAEIDQIKVNHFFLNQVFSRWGQNHFREQPGSVYTTSGIIDDSLDDLLSDKSLTFIIQNAFKVLSQIVEFVLFVALKVYFLAGLFAWFLFGCELRFGDVHIVISTLLGLDSDCVDQVFNLIRLL